VIAFDAPFPPLGLPTVNGKHLAAALACDRLLKIGLLSAWFREGDLSPGFARVAFSECPTTHPVS
jgi:hypothetical protein